MADVRIDVDLKGPFFAARIDDATRRAIVGEVLDKAEQRMMRRARSPKAGRKNNTLSSRRHQSAAEQSVSVDTTLNYPRTKGTSWLRYNVGAVRKLAPNVIRAAGRRIARELGGQ